MTSGGNDVNDFVIINLPNFVQFKQYYGKILSMVKGLGGVPPLIPLETTPMAIGVEGPV